MLSLEMRIFLCVLSCSLFFPLCCSLLPLLRFSPFRESLLFGYLSSSLHLFSIPSTRDMLKIIQLIKKQQKTTPLKKKLAEELDRHFFKEGIYMAMGT